ncbi:MAG TPA: hypothetical protein VI703_02165 [Anaerolineales bacterium]|nr:hypothetical protein [Anaerolineales bacterium]
MASKNGSVFKQPYLAIRRNIGFLAMALPFTVWIGALLIPPSVGVRSSISAYYHTEMRNVFVGILFSMGVFLFTYNPKFYDKSYGKGDQYLGMLAGVAAAMVALFPTPRDNWREIFPPAPYDEGAYGVIHFIAAGVLFGSMVYFSYFLFTETKPGKRIRRGSIKAKRNRVYRAMAVVMLLCMLLIGVYFVTGFAPISPDVLAKFPPVFFLEWAAIWAFGISWSVKGEALEQITDRAKRLGREAIKLRKQMGLRLH